LADASLHWRLALAWKLLFAAYLGLAFVSLAIFSRGFDSRTADGRHLLAGALANLGLVWMGLFIAATAYREGRRWAWLACLACLYGLPLMVIDTGKFGITSRTLLPQVIGLGLALSGLLLPIDLFFSSQSTRNGDP
jgi:hypothetical protein